MIEESQVEHNLCVKLPESIPVDGPFARRCRSFDESIEVTTGEEVEVPQLWKGDELLISTDVGNRNSLLDKIRDIISTSARTGEGVYTY